MSRYEAIVAVVAIIFGTASFVGVALAIAWGVKGRKGTVTDGGAMARVDQRLERMEQAIDAMAVEMERYGCLADYPDGVLHAGHRPLLQYPVEALEASLQNAQAIGIALRDGVSDKIVAYALGSPLENYDEEGVSDDPHLGENATFYMQAMATLPSVANRSEVEGQLLEQLRDRAAARGFEYFSALVEDSVREHGPEWLRQAEVLHTAEDYLQSGQRFVYVQAAIRDGAAMPAGVEGR